MQSNSKLVQWSDSYRIGLAAIDDQHRSLVDLINDLWQLIAANRQAAESQAILERLEHYTLAHFAAEEAMMQAIEYPDFESHRYAHYIFAARLKVEKNRLDQGGKLNLDILHFLQDWLVKHIQAEDKAYADYYLGQKKPSGLLTRLFSMFRAQN